MHTQVYFLLLLGAIESCRCKVLPQEGPEDGPLILTPYIERGEIEKAKNLSAVDPSQFAGVNSHAAYFTVNKTNGWHLFFWYFPAQGVPLDSTPLIIWLQGGPGGSSLFGLLAEIGPIQIKNGKAERREITWGSDYSLLFIDNPVGTGFSFTENENLYVTNEDMVGECLLSFIQQFLQIFPELRKAPLFIAGESYAGKYIPAFGHYIHHNKNDSMPINLKGLAIGDGLIDPVSLLHYSKFAQQIGIVDIEQAEIINAFETAARKCWSENDTQCFKENATKAFYELSGFASLNNAYNYIDDSDQTSIFVDLNDFLNKQEIQKSIHVKPSFKYSCINSIVGQYLQDDLYDTKPWLEELLEDYGVMCYNGQLDVIIAYAVSVHTYRSLKWSGQEAYLNADRKPIFDDAYSRVNSYVKGNGNFMEVMVRGAGHAVPIDQPRAAKQIIDMFIQKFK